jgi:hypothetical protein
VLLPAGGLINESAPQAGTVAEVLVNDAVREYRLTMFGSHCIGATVTSAHAHDDLHGWRHGQHTTVKVNPTSIPSSLNERLQRFVTACLLAFGAFDTLETADGQFYFLEVDEAGQFLWIEHCNSDVRLLKPFSDFVIRRIDWSRNLRRADVTLSTRSLETAF